MLAAPALAEDPPARVGSLNYISGEVAYALRGEPGEPGRADALSWSQADFNQPVCQDMSLKTGAMARARVRIGPDAIQMSGDTWLNMLNLSDQLIEASVRYGRVHLQLSKLEDGQSVELEMPRGSLWLLQAGAYDIDTGTADQPTRIVVFEGKARFVGGQADLPIAAGEEVQVAGNYPAVVTTEHHAAGANAAAPISIPASATTAPAAPEPNPPQAALPAAPPEAKTGPSSEPPPASSSPPAAVAESRPSPSSPAPATANAQSGSAKANSAVADAGHAPADDFLLWVEEADNQPQPPPQSAQYVSPETTGYDALDRYGRWETLPDAGPVWFPTSVPDDWAPYRFGHWDSIAPWGWTWIDDQPWGFAPFHYGRWINVDGHWGWVPGAVVPHPVYAPALVAFIDTSDNSPGGADGGPDIGWFPLGPDDDYSPWYPAGPGYVESVNVVVHGHFHDFGARGYGGRGPDAWRGQYFNRRFATVVSRDAFAGARQVNHEMMRLPTDRLERAAVMREAPRVMPSAMRTMMGPGGANTAAQREAGPGRANPEAAVGRRAPAAAGLPGRGGERPRQELGRSEVGHNPGEAYRGGAPQYGRPQVFQNSTQGYRGGMQKFGQPQVFQTPAASYRAGGMIGHGVPQIAARPAAVHVGGGGAGRRK